VQPGGVVLLDDEARGRLGGCAVALAVAGGLGGALRIALALVLVEPVTGGHTHSVPARAVVYGATAWR
jgi:hypothetical protein